MIKKPLLVFAGCLIGILSLLSSCQQQHQHSTLFSANGIWLNELFLKQLENKKSLQQSLSASELLSIEFQFKEGIKHVRQNNTDLIENLSALDNNEVHFSIDSQQLSINQQTFTSISTNNLEEFFYRKLLKGNYLLHDSIHVHFGDDFQITGITNIESCSLPVNLEKNKWIFDRLTFHASSPAYEFLYGYEIQQDELFIFELICDQENSDKSGCYRYRKGDVIYKLKKVMNSES